jgi:hypothetical protein
VVAGELGEGWIAVDGHYQIGLGEDRPENVHHTVRAAEGEAPRVGAAHSDRGGAEGEGLDHVGARAHAGVEQDRGVIGGLDDVGQTVEGGQTAVCLAAAVVGAVDAVDAAVDRAAGVVGVQDAL